MKGIYFLLAIVAIAIAAPISLSSTFTPTVELQLDSPDAPVVLIDSLPVGAGNTNDFEIDGCPSARFELFGESNPDAYKFAFADFGTFLGCFTKRGPAGGRKRGFVDYVDETVEDYNAWDALLTITNVNTNVNGARTSKMEKELKLWFPKNLIIRKSISVTDNVLVSDAALTSLTFDHSGSGLWTVEFEFTVETPYGPKANSGSDSIPTFEPDALPDTITRTFTKITESDGKYKFTFTVARCDGWSTKGTISIPTACLSGSDPCVTSTPEDIEIEVDITTASACAVSQVFDFQESIELYSGGEDVSKSSTSVETPVTTDQWIYIALEVGTFPDGEIQPTFALTRICTKATSTGKATSCDNDGRIIPAGSYTAKGTTDLAILGETLLTHYLNGVSTHGATFDLVAEYSVTYETAGKRKRNVALKRVAKAITIEEVRLPSTASSISFVPLLLAAIAVFLA